MKKEKRFYTLNELDPDVIKGLDRFIQLRGWSGRIQCLQIYTFEQHAETLRERMRLSLNEYGSYLKDKFGSTQGWLRIKLSLFTQGEGVKPVHIWFHKGHWKRSSTKGTKVSLVPKKEGIL